EAAGDDPGILHGLPGQFEEDALLRVDAPRLARRDAEKRRVEAVDIGDEAAVAGVHLARTARVGAEIGGDVPAILGDRADRIDPVMEQRPELGHVPGAREPACDADHGDRKGASRTGTPCTHLRPYPPAALRRPRFAAQRVSTEPDAWRRGP